MEQIVKGKTLKLGINVDGLPSGVSLLSSGVSFSIDVYTRGKYSSKTELESGTSDLPTPTENDPNYITVFIDTEDMNTGFLQLVLNLSYKDSDFPTRTISDKILIEPDMLIVAPK